MTGTRDEERPNFSEKHYGSLENSGAEGSLERQYMRAFLFESMGTLGLVDVAYVRLHSLWPEFRGGWGTDDLPFCGRYDGLLYVRLNGRAAMPRVALWPAACTCTACRPDGRWKRASCHAFSTRRPWSRSVPSGPT